MKETCKNCRWVKVENFKSPGTQEITETFRCFHKPIPVQKQPEDFCSFFESAIPEREIKMSEPAIKVDIPKPKPVQKKSYKK